MNSQIGQEIKANDVISDQKIPCQRLSSVQIDQADQMCIIQDQQFF